MDKNHLLKLLFHVHIFRVSWIIDQKLSDLIHRWQELLKIKKLKKKHLDDNTMVHNSLTHTQSTEKIY